MTLANAEGSLSERVSKCFFPSWHWKIETEHQKNESFQRSCPGNEFTSLGFYLGNMGIWKITLWRWHDRFGFPRAYSNKLTFPLRNRPPDLGLGMAILEHAATGSVFLLPKNHDVRLGVVLPIPQGANGVIFWLWAGPGGKRPRIVGTEAKCSMVWYMFLYCIHLGHFVV